MCLKTSSLNKFDEYELRRHFAKKIVASSESTLIDWRSLWDINFLTYDIFYSLKLGITNIL